eukprot:676718-Rhodomonas_salina.2
MRISLCIHDVSTGHCIANSQQDTLFAFAFQNPLTLITQYASSGRSIWILGIGVEDLGCGVEGCRVGDSAVCNLVLGVEDWGLRGWGFGLGV